jgi:NadR type nicotinamide-nucleotide adenylyltransferase
MERMCGIRGRKQVPAVGIKIGLTLGKYAPFHGGHGYVIDTAVAEMDQVIVMVYEDDVTDVPLHVRAGWIRCAYAYVADKVDVIECCDCPQGVGYTPEIMAMHEKYILKVLAGRQITHFYSSEPYGEHVSQALNATDRRVDMGRCVFPICSTQIREDSYKHKEYILNAVYWDLITKVVFLGSESTGKSTKAKMCAEQFDTQFMPEYGAEYWFEHQKDGVLTSEQLVEIARGHIRREDEMILLSRKYCFIDTNALTTYMFAEDYHGYVLPELQQLADDCYGRYDVFFLCEVDIPYEDTWDRRGAENRRVFQKKIVDDLVERRIPFFRLDGSLDKRLKKVKEVLAGHKKWDSCL